MFPKIIISSFSFPLYPICVAIGFLIGTIILQKIFVKNGSSENLAFYAMCFTEAGVIIGGKILFWIINFYRLKKVYETFGLIGLFSKTGFVFYGGLFGGVLGIFVFSKFFKQSFIEILTFVISITPLIHAFGRFGCLCAGCCYGTPYSGLFSVYLRGENRFPVQALEATLNIFLFVVLQILLAKNKKSVIPIYFFSYGLIRFFCEQFRDDVKRGFIGCLSVSSWISLFIIIAGIVTFIIILNNKKGKK